MIYYPDDIPTPARRTIPIGGVSDGFYATLRGSAKPDCYKCRGSGIHSYKRHGTHVLICACAYKVFGQATAYLEEEEQRRRQGLPPRKASLKDGVFELGMLPGAYAAEETVEETNGPVL